MAYGRGPPAVRWPKAVDPVEGSSEGVGGAGANAITGGGAIAGPAAVQM